MQQAVVNIQNLLQQLITEGNLDMPMLPKVAGEVIVLTQDENSDMHKLADLIQKDQSLASRLMKIANSPAYCGINPMTSLQQAISRMGMKLIAEVALAASVGAKVFHVKGFEQEVTYLWRHALASSVWAKEIARMRRRNVESAFMCGLLHQIGKPVVLQTIVDLMKEHQLQLAKEEIQELIAEYYVAVGVKLGNDWDLPNTVVESIEYHQDYTQAPRALQEAMTSNAANQLATMLLTGEPLQTENIMQDEVMEQLNLYEEDIQQFVDKRESILQVVEAMAL